MKIKLLIFSIISILLFFSCNKTDNVPFQTLTNFEFSNDTLLLEMDLQNVVFNGIEIPSKTQNENGFEFQFEFPDYKKGNYFYKIYYQNDSYKFEENDPLAYENFYGSWEDTNIEFKPITSSSTNDYIRIVGNPRSEEIYFGAPISEFEITEEKLQKVYVAMRNTPDWMKGIKEKAQREQRTLENQIYLDALWMLDAKRNEGTENHRWKRNPRTGNYSFLLVICDEKSLENIPDYIKNISKKNPENNQFVNPFSYFSKNLDAKIWVQKSAQVLKTRAVISPQFGVYVDQLSFFEKLEVSQENQLCNDSHQLFENALFEQYFHHINTNYKLQNIPVVEDVSEATYSQLDYENNAKKYDKRRNNDYPTITSNPCKTVAANSNFIQLINPGNASKEKPTKENVGIRARVGFTYGKFIGKIKFPKLLNNHNVTNGLTNAFWLIFQSDKPWNYRRDSKSGYLSKDYDYKSNVEPEKLKSYYYSEIDIEIVKASRKWPQKNNNIDAERNNNDVMFCCTNWDMACADPKDYQTENNIHFNNQKFFSFRWHKYYNATTIRNPIPQSELFDGEFCYYEIEWKPTEIIWRVGKSLDNMKVMGYMNSDFTSIPNNQMRAVVTQEFHYGEWWPPIVWDQKNIPYPKNNITGKVYEIIIE